MKTIITLTLTAALTAATIHASAQDDALARLRAQRAQEQQQLGGQPADAAAPATAAPAETPAPDASAQQMPDAAPATTPADTASSPQDDPLARLKAQRLQELSGGAQPSVAPAAPTVGDATSVQPQSSTPMQLPEYATSAPASLSTNGITFNFRNAALADVLTYMSDAAGYTILLQAQVNSRVTIISTHPMTKEKAVDVLNSILNQNNLAAVANDDDQTLTIMTKDAAKTGNIPVVVGNSYTNIPKNDTIITQIIPIRFVDAQQLVVDMSPFVSPQAIIEANAAGNSIIITDTQANIRHLVEIISSIDSSAEMQTAVQVFTLKYANPNDVVSTLASVFPSTGGGTTTSVGGRGGRGGGGNPFAALFGGGGGGNNANSSAARVQKAQSVLAVADGRTQSVVVTAAKDMMPEIGEMIAQLDVPSERDQNVQTIALHNADPYQVAAVLQGMFGGTTQSRGGTSTTTSGDLLGGRPNTMNNSSGSTGFGSSSGSSRSSGSLF